MVLEAKEILNIEWKKEEQHWVNNKKKSQKLWLYFISIEETRVFLPSHTLLYPSLLTSALTSISCLSALYTHTIHSFRAAHNSLTCFDKKCTLSHTPEAMVTQKSQVNKDHLHFLWAFSSSSSPSGSQGLGKERKKCQGSLCQVLKKKKSPKSTIGCSPNLLLPCLKENGLLLLASFTSKEFFIPSRSWSLTYLSPLMMYKKVEEISQYSFKTVFYKDANKMIYIVSQFNIFDICSVIKFTSYICFFKLIHMLPTSIPQLLFWDVLVAYL